MKRNLYIFAEAPIVQKY